MGKCHYTNNTGRNDIVKVRITHDSKNVYFYVETAKPLTPKSDAAWMRLFIDIDRDRNTGWEGYDYIINRISPLNKAIIEKNQGGWSWAKVGVIDYSFSENKLELAVPKKLLELDKDINIEFKWSDNVQQDGDVMDFYLNGDVAPLGRFNYVYEKP